MSVDAEYLEGLKPGSSPFWLRKLGMILDDRRKTGGSKKTMADYRAYYRGDHPLLFASARFQQAFNGLFKEWADNFCGVIVDATLERLAVQGFRYGDNQEAAALAWRAWQANNLDLEMTKGFREALVAGEASIIVGPGADPAVPEITVEDPLTTVVVVSGRRRVVAMKRWFDAETNRMQATLYYPDKVEKYHSRQAAGWFSSSVDDWMHIVSWDRRETPGEPWPLPHDLGVVPVVPLVNKPDLYGLGESDLRDVVPIQAGINKLVLDMFVAAEFSAYRQRWVTGLDVPKDPTTGKEVAPFRAGMDSVWSAPPVKMGEQPVQFGEFSQTDLKPYVEGVGMLIEHAATNSRLPLHYLLSTAVLPSGESQSAAEAGLVAKVRFKWLDFSDPLEETNRLVFRQLGRRDLAAIPDGETIWKDPEHRTESEHVDALMKLQSLNVPEEVIWEKLPASPGEIERWRRLNLRRQIELSAAQADIYGALIRAGVTPQAAAAASGAPPMRHTGLLPVTLQPSPGGVVPAGNGAEPTDAG